MDELDRVEIAEREQERADGGEGRRHAEMADGEPAKAEEADRRYRGHHHHEGGERIEAEAAKRGMRGAEQEERVRVAERAAFGKEDDGVGPMDSAGEHMAPVLDDGEGEIAVLVVAERPVEAGEQPAAKQQRKAEREQRERQQAGPGQADAGGRTVIVIVSTLDLSSPGSTGRSSNHRPMGYGRVASMGRGYWMPRFRGA